MAAAVSSREGLQWFALHVAVGFLFQIAVAGERAEPHPDGVGIDPLAATFHRINERRRGHRRVAELFPERHTHLAALSLFIPDARRLPAVRDLDALRGRVPLTVHWIAFEPPPDFLRNQPHH